MSSPTLVDCRLFDLLSQPYPEHLDDTQTSTEPQASPQPTKTPTTTPTTIIDFARWEGEAGSAWPRYAGERSDESSSLIAEDLTAELDPITSIGNVPPNNFPTQDEDAWWARLDAATLTAQQHSSALVYPSAHYMRSLNILDRCSLAFLRPGRRLPIKPGFMTRLLKVYGIMWLLVTGLWTVPIVRLLGVVGEYGYDPRETALSVGLFPLMQVGLAGVACIALGMLLTWFFASTDPHCTRITWVRLATLLLYGVLLCTTLLPMLVNTAAMSISLGMLMMPNWFASVISYTLIAVFMASAWLGMVWQAIVRERLALRAARLQLPDEVFPDPQQLTADIAEINRIIDQGWLAGMPSELMNEAYRRRTDLQEQLHQMVPTPVVLLDASQQTRRTP